MSRVSIQQFRSTLASHSDQGALVGAYRELSRRSGPARGALFAGWIPWQDPPVSATPA